MKAFITRRVERFRAPYARRITEHARQCVFAGSTNDAEYLRDHTGGRRYWPVKVASIVDTDRLLAAKDQLWAEATTLYRQGAKWWIDESESDLMVTVKAEQAERLEEDPWHEIMALHLGRLGEEESISNEEILTVVIKKDPAQQVQADRRRIGRILTSLGWERFRVRQSDGLVWRFRRKSV